MRKLTANMFVTADGVMQAPGAPDEDRSGGFSYGGWIATYWDNTMQDILGAWMSRPFDLLLGRKTYEIFAAYWPRVTNDPTATGLNNATKYVASRTLKQLDWQPAQLLGPDVPKAVAELKRGDGRELQLHGSGDLLQTLFRYKLVDEIRIWTFPLVLGTGKRLFRDGTAPGGLELIDSAVSTTGVQTANYKTGAAIRLGTVEPSKRSSTGARRSPGKGSLTSSSYDRLTSGSAMKQRPVSLACVSTISFEKETISRGVADRARPPWVIPGARALVR